VKDEAKIGVWESRAGMTCEHGLKIREKEI